MIGNSYTGAQVDARRIVSVLDRLQGAIDQCNDLVSLYAHNGLPTQTEAAAQKRHGLEYAASLLQELLDGIDVAS